MAAHCMVGAMEHTMGQHFTMAGFHNGACPGPWTGPLGCRSNSRRAPAKAAQSNNNAFLPLELPTFRNCHRDRVILEHTINIPSSTCRAFTLDPHAILCIQPPQPVSRVVVVIVVVFAVVAVFCGWCCGRGWLLLWLWLWLWFGWLWSWSVVAVAAAVVMAFCCCCCCCCCGLSFVHVSSSKYVMFQCKKTTTTKRTRLQRRYHRFSRESRGVSVLAPFMFIDSQYTQCPC